MANTSADPASAPTGAPKYHEPLLRTFLVQFAGTAAAALAGILISAGTVNWIIKLIVPERLPKGVIVFVKEEDCGDKDSDWKPLARGRGHFVVLADGAEFRADHDEAGAPKEIQIDKSNLPSLSGKIAFEAPGLPPLAGTPSDVFKFVRKIDPAVEISVDGKGNPVKVRPPWIALTGCEKK